MEIITESDRVIVTDYTPAEYDKIVAVLKSGGYSFGGTLMRLIIATNNVTATKKLVEDAVA